MTAMTLDELRELAQTELTTDVETAGRAYGIGRAKAYRLAKAGQFPVPVLTVAGRYRVRTAALAADLLLHSEAESTATADSASTTSHLGQKNGSQHHGSPLHAA